MNCQNEYCEYRDKLQLCNGERGKYTCMAKKPCWECDEGGRCSEEFSTGLHFCSPIRIWQRLMDRGNWDK